jgi:hypothetical protein
MRPVNKQINTSLPSPDDEPVKPVKPARKRSGAPLGRPFGSKAASTKEVLLVTVDARYIAIAEAAGGAKRNKSLGVRNALDAWAKANPKILKDLVAK